MVYTKVSLFKGRKGKMILADLITLAVCLIPAGVVYSIVGLDYLTLSMVAVGVVVYLFIIRKEG
jgi:hypothetical protein